MAEPQSPDLPARIGAALLQSRSDAVVYSDREGTIRVWNAGAERIFGFTADEAIGQSLDIIIPPPLRERHWTGYRQVMESGESRYGEGDLLRVPGLRKDGSRISLEFTIVPLHGSAGGMEGIAAVLRDVTAQFEETRALRQRLKSLEAPHR